MSPISRRHKPIDLAASAASQPGDAASAADYVAAMSGDLASIARRHGLETLGYLLDMARLEAESVTAQDGAPASER